MEGALIAVRSERLGPVDADQLHPVPRPHAVHVGVVADHRQAGSTLPLGHQLRQFLDLYVLLIRKRAEVMHNLHGLLAEADSAHLRLLHLGVEQRHCDFVAAVFALEPGSLHLWVDFGDADGDGPQHDQFADVLRPQLSHADYVVFVETFDAGHYGGLLGLLARAVHVVGLRLHEVAPEQLSEDLVENGNHLCGKVDKLEVQFSIELSQMLPLDFEHDRLVFWEVVQFYAVDLLAYVFVVDVVGELEF